MEKERLLKLLKSEPNKVDAIGMILSNYTDFGHTEKGGMVSVAQFKKVAECILEWSEGQKGEDSTEALHKHDVTDAVCCHTCLYDKKGNCQNSTGCDFKYNNWRQKTER